MPVRPRKAFPKLLPLLLAALLVLLQTGAVLHALGHLADDERTDAPAVPQHALCALCAAYAGNDGALAATPPLVVSLGMVAPAPVALRSLVYLPPLALPYQVRAPPAPAVG